MACKKCNTSRCGCADTGLNTPTVFSNDPVACPVNSETCSELYPMACVCYQGEDIVELNIQKGDRLEEVLQKLILAIVSPGCATFAEDASCGAPINLTVSNLTSTSLQLAWDTVPGAISYTVEYKEALLLTWNLTPSIVAPATEVIIVGLTANTVYDLRVNAICSAGTCYSLNIRVQTATA